MYVNIYMRAFASYEMILHTVWSLWFHKFLHVLPRLLMLPPPSDPILDWRLFILWLPTVADLCMVSDWILDLALILTGLGDYYMKEVLT